LYKNVEAIIKQRSGAVKRKGDFIAIDEQFPLVVREHFPSAANRSLHTEEFRGKFARHFLSILAFLAE
jgi:hypothetical protein